jgi:hypothetical protein
MSRLVDFAASSPRSDLDRLRDRLSVLRNVGGHVNIRALLGFCDDEGNTNYSKSAVCAAAPYITLEIIFL